jgi:Class III cytochrome C family
MMGFRQTFLITMSLVACVPRAPKVGDQQTVRPTFEHGAFLADNTCSSCHGTQRPAPIDDEVHGGGGECQECHVPKDDRSGWLPVNSYSHNPKPTSCNKCHAHKRPPEPHPQKTDCVSCHNTKSFTNLGTSE